MRPLNADAFLYINLPHNRWMTSAQQLMDIRTAADMQAHNSCCAVHDSIFPNDRYYIFQQLILYLPNRRRHIYIEQQRLKNEHESPHAFC